MSYDGMDTYAEANLIINIPEQFVCLFVYMMMLEDEKCKFISALFHCEYNL